MSLNFSIINIRSLCNKYDDFMEHVGDNNFDLVFISETWLSSQKSDCTAFFQQFSYVLHHSIRQCRVKDRGGGVGILVKSSLHVNQYTMREYVSFEHHALKVIGHGNRSTILVSIYRLVWASNDIFFSEIRDLLEILSAAGKFIIAGDINIHLDDSSNSVTEKFMEVLNEFDLAQVIEKPTHRAGHTLDILIFPRTEIICQILDVRDICISDHFLITCSLTLNVKIKKEIKTVSY